MSKGMFNLDVYHKIILIFARNVKVCNSMNYIKANIAAQG